MSNLSAGLETLKVDTNHKNKEGENARLKVEERVNNMQTNIREIYEKINQVSNPN